MLLEQPQTQATPLNQRVNEFSFDGTVKTKDAALDLVIADTTRSEKFLEGRLWMSEWRIAKALYEAPVKQEYWKDTLVPRAANSFPLVSQHIRAILDQTMPALFPEVLPVGVEPNESTPRQVTRGWESFLKYQVKDTHLKENLRLVAKDALVFGTGLGKWGWETFQRKRTVYRRKQQPTELPSILPNVPPQMVDTDESDEIEAIDFVETVSRPFFKRIEINHLLVDTSLRSPNIRDAKYVVYRNYLTIRDLNKLRDFEGYTIPSEEVLRALVEPPAEQATMSHMEAEATAFPAQGHRPSPRYDDSTKDPMEHPLEVLERWTADSVIVVLQRKLVIRNEKNPFGVIPFVSCFWDDMPGTFYAFGIPRRIGGAQTHIQGLRNTRLDDVHLNLMKMWKVKKGTNIAAQPIRACPGAIFKVDDMNSFEPIEQSPILAEAYKEEEVMLSDAEKTSGANEMLIQGAMPTGGRSSMTRTATGAGAVAGASNSRIQSFADVVADQCLLPVMYAFVAMDKEFANPALIRKVIGNTLWKAMAQAYDGDDLMLDMYNANVEFHLLAGSKIAAKQKMVSSLPLLAQMYSSPAFQGGLASAGYKINYLELGYRFEQATDWKSPEDMFIPQTAQDKQAAMQGNKVVLNAKATQQRLAQMHQQNMQQSAQDNQNKLQQIDAKGLADAGQAIITRALERATEREEMPFLQGEFGGQ